MLNLFAIPQGEAKLSTTVKTAHFKVAHRLSSRTEKVRGVDVLVTLSPFFTPETVEAVYDEKIGCMVIKFKYFDNEPSQQAKEDHPLFDVFLGKHTERLMALHLKVEANQITAVDMVIVPETKRWVLDRTHEAIQTVREIQPKMAENYAFIEEFVFSHGDALAALVG